MKCAECASISVEPDNTTLNFSVKWKFCREHTLFFNHSWRKFYCNNSKNNNKNNMKQAENYVP